MSNAPNLLNDDGTASIATLILMSHHAFRRDVARFAKALERVAKGDASRVEALREEWKIYRRALHLHHEVEDTAIFPRLQSTEQALAPTIEQLSADHRRIDPLLERGDSAFADLPSTAAALQVVSELAELLDAHLALEEAEVIPFLRTAKEFPPLADDATAELYAQGFAWTMNGIASEVVEQVKKMLPQDLMSRVPAACVAFEARCERAWGSAQAGTSRTSIPDHTV